MHASAGSKLDSAAAAQRSTAIDDAISESSRLLQEILRETEVEDDSYTAVTPRSVTAATAGAMDVDNIIAGVELDARGQPSPRVHTATASYSSTQTQRAVGAQSQQQQQQQRSSESSYRHRRSRSRSRSPRRQQYSASGLRSSATVSSHSSSSISSSSSSSTSMAAAEAREQRVLRGGNHDMISPLQVKRRMRGGAQAGGTIRLDTLDQVCTACMQLIAVYNKTVNKVNKYYDSVWYV
jgi:hypothetical protein